MPVEFDVIWLRERAAVARRIAASVNHPLAVKDLLKHADVLEAKAAEIEAAMPVLPAAAAIPSGEPPIARAGAALNSEVPPDPEADGTERSA